MSLLRDGVYPADAPMPKSQIKHFLLTRFNMRLAESPEVDASWVEQRLPIFNEICWPSVVNQKVRPSRWLIGVDGESTEQVSQLAEQISRHPWIRLAVQRPGEALEDTFERELATENLDGATHVITSRVDCDDAIALDYLRDVERYALSVLGRGLGDDDFWVSLPYGAQLSGGRFFAYPHVRGHFLARVAAADRVIEDNLTVMRARHSRVFEHGQPVFVAMTSMPVWLQNVHGGNLLNKELVDALELQPADRVRQLFFPPLADAVG